MMRSTIIRLIGTVRLQPTVPASINPRHRVEASHFNGVRWQTSGNNQDGEETEPDFGVLRKRVLDKVGDNLDQIMKFNAFELFGIKQQFKVDTNALRREMRQLQRILHPDKFVDENEENQRKSDYLSSAVNDFYTILTNPYERAKYLLSLKLDKSPSEIERSLDELQMDGEFLARMMEVREKISDRHCDTFELKKMGSVIESDLQDLIRQLDQDFKSDNSMAILEKLGKLKFLVNCHRKIAERDDSFSMY